MIKIFGKSVPGEGDRAGKMVYQVTATITLDEFINKQPRQLGELLCTRVIEGIAQRFIEMNYNEIVAGMDPAHLRTEVMKAAADQLAKQMIKKLMT